MSKIHNIQKMVDRRRELRRYSTEQEKKLWEKLRKSQLGYKFRRQHSIGGYIVDFYCAETRLVIEIDGSSHDVLDQKEYDSVRDQFLKDLNHTVLRFKNEEVDAEIEKVITKIQKNLSPSPSPESGEGKKG